MKFFALVAVLSAAAFVSHNASAQDRYEYCMESGDGGGGSTINCAFETMAQCIASKSSPADKCYRNPRSPAR